MQKKILLAALAAASITSADAVVVVNGVVGEDLDNTSPFETLQAALDFANNSSETVIEIQTEGPIAGASLSGKVINHPLTIQAGAGFRPTVETGLDLLPTTGTELITLSGLNVSTTGVNTPLIVGTAITAENCIFNTNPAPGAYGPAVTAAVAGPTTTATLTLTSCTLIGHWGLQAGRVCRDYNLTRCEVIGLPTDLPPIFSHGINNNMNWFSSFSSRMGAAEGFDEITEPRAVTLNQCIVRGGIPLAWPSTTLDTTHYANENATIGPVTAINTVFDALPINAPGEANRINHPSLPPTQNASSTFTHCTFRSANAFGLFYFFGGQPSTYTFTNCLFDMMLGNYGIGVDPAAAANVTLTGDANAYHVPAAVELFPFDPPTPPFEATKHFYIGNTAQEANISGNNGQLIRAHDQIVAQAIATSPAVTIDKDGNPRPLPVSASASDIGADEIDETAPASVDDWTIY